jgi:hypothetical protein
MEFAEVLSRLRRGEGSDHTVDVGLRTEAIITSDLLRRGMRVLLPCGFNHRCDLVIDMDGVFVRAQCKTGRLRGGAIHFNSQSVRCDMTQATRRGYLGDADIFLVYCPGTKGIYAVPVGDASLRQMTLRVEPAANSQVKGVRWASDYALPA